MNASPDTADGMKEVSAEELFHFADFFGLTKAAPSRVSHLLMFELYCHAFMPGAAGITPKVIAEIGSLEGLRPIQGTRGAEQFRHLPLRGLWKTHYLRDGAEAVPMNIKLEMERQDKALNAFIGSVLRSYPEEPTIEQKMEMSQRIAHKVAHDLYLERKARGALTGEWIIFARHEGRNHYLTLARHSEDDGVIHRRIVDACLPQFPFLSEVISAA